MRNLKKFLALVLALMMVMSVMVTVSAATSYTDDKDIDAQYSEAIDVLSALGVLQGRGEAGNSAFDPKKGLSRAEAAKLVGFMLLGSDVEDLPTEAHFSDVPTTHWANKFVNYASLKEIVDGENEKFRPNDEVTGYEFGKMVLVAAGFDADKYTGNSLWSLNVAEDVKNVTEDSGYELKAGALSSKSISREAAAQLAFAVLNYTIGDTTYTVFIDYDGDGLQDLGEEVIYEGNNYNRAMLYAQSTGAVVIATDETLGFDVFGLALDTADADDWGRPARTWRVYGVKLKSYPATPVAKYDHKVSECDVVDDYSSLDKAVVSTYYLNGKSTTTATFSTDTSNNTIDALQVAGYIGGQGQVTEIYKTGLTYRVVQIDTYLACVAAVSPAVADAKGHLSTPTVTLNVYTAYDTTNANGNWAVTVPVTVATDKYALGQYVLVNINEGKIATGSTLTATPTALTIVDFAPIMAVGTVTTWSLESYPTPASTTVGTTKLFDSKNYALNKHITGTWAALGDGMGNIIGQGEMTTNYAVIEAIAWIHNGLRDGYAVADLVLGDGTRTENAVISTINGRPATNLGDGAPAATDVLLGKLSDDYTNNGVYYNHLVGYSRNTDGSYNLSVHAANTTGFFETTVGVNDGVVDSTQGRVYRTTDGQSLATNENTTFLVYNALTRQYDVVKGKSAMKSLVNCQICGVVGADGYASLVVVNGTLSGNTFLAMVLNVNREGNVPTLGDVYHVYKVGENAATTIYQTVGDPYLANVAANGTGLYQFTVDNRGVLTSAVPAAVVSTNSANGTFVNFGNNVIGMADTVVTGFAGMSFVTSTPGCVMNLRSDAKVYIVTKSGAAAGDFAIIREGVFTDIKRGEKVLVVYDATVGTINWVNAVYVIKTDTSLAPAPGPQPGAGKVTLAASSVDVGKVTFTAAWAPDADYPLTYDESVYVQYRASSSAAWVDLGATAMTNTGAAGGVYTYSITTSSLAQGQTLQFRAVVRASQSASAKVLAEGSAVTIYIP